MANPSNSCQAMSLKNSNVNLLVVLEETVQGNTKVRRLYSPGTVNVGFDYSVGVSTSSAMSKMVTCAARGERGQEAITLA